MRHNNSRHKIDRAKKHLFDIKDRITRLINSNVATVEINPNGGNEVIKHDISDRLASIDIALMVGDAVHNLKSALDYAWSDTLGDDGSLDKFRKFPVYPSRHELKNALRGRNIDVSHPALYELMLDTIHSYEGGNEILFHVHRLNIADKHRLLLPVIHYTSISGIVTEDEFGELHHDGYTMGTLQQPPWYIPMFSGHRVKEKGRLSLSVVFGEGVPPEGMDVSDELEIAAIETQRIVELLESDIS